MRDCGLERRLWVLLLVFGAGAGCATAEDQAADSANPPVPDAGIDSGLVPKADAAGPDDPDPTGTPDAAPPPDAPVAAADAAPPDACVPSVVNLLANASFDQGPGSGWMESSSAGYNIVVDQATTPISAHTPAHHVWLGGYMSDSSAGVSGVDQLRQDVTLPADATGFQVIGYRLIGTEESTGEGAGEFDRLKVTIRDTSGGVLETLHDPQIPACGAGGCTWSNEDAVGSFTSFTLTPSGDYAGQTIRIHVESQVDSVLNTNFFLDTLTARVTTCP